MLGNMLDPPFDLQLLTQVVLKQVVFLGQLLETREYTFCV